MTLKDMLNSVWNTKNTNLMIGSNLLFIEWQLGHIKISRTNFKTSSFLFRFRNFWVSFQKSFYSIAFSYCFYNMFSSKLNGILTFSVSLNMLQNIFLMLIVQKVKAKVKYRSSLKFTFCIAVFILKNLLMNFHQMESQPKDISLMD